MDLSTNMDDTSYLIHLEAYKCFKDEEAHLRRTVEEKTKHYREIKGEYLNLYSKYVDILKLCATRESLQAKELHDRDNVVQAANNIQTIDRKTSIDKQMEFLPTDSLAATKDILGNTPDLKNISQLHYATANQRNRVDFIQSSSARVESKLESSIASGLDSFVKRIED